MRRALVTLLMFISLDASSQGTGRVTPKGAFQLDVDVARYAGNEEQLYVELYYGIRENCLTYVEDAAGYSGGATITMVIRTDTAVAFQRGWAVPHAIRDTTSLERGQALLGLQNVGLPFGRYTLELRAADIHDSSRMDSVAFPLSIPALPLTRELLSDLELCSSIKDGTDTAIAFYKNTLEVLPNPSRLYGIGLPVLYYYVEVYNLVSSGKAGDMVLRTSVLDALGNIVLHNDKKKARKLNSSVEVGTVNLSRVKGGTYTLTVALVAAGDSILAQSSKKFFVYNPQIDGGATASRGVDYVGSEFAIKTEEELDREFDCSRYVSTQMERDQYARLTGVDAKRKFLFEFWTRLDPDPASPGNAYREKYLERVAYASKSFRSPGREGWKTDRGRVYVVYGPMSDVERHPSEPESNPYEIWRYDELQGGVIFVFVDRTGMGDYMLVHSTHRDELRDDDWFNRHAKKLD